MTGLKKRDRSGRKKKEKERQKAKNKGGKDGIKVERANAAA